ncbi:MAG: NAD(P)/FAD-dependent oxidoreductase [Candidatus Heimdallarchaeaceae archaeon]
MTKKKEKNYDVIIVGAGIAGCVLGFHLANARIKVKVIEKKNRDNLAQDCCDSIEKKAFAYAGIQAPKGDEIRDERDHLAIITPDLQTIIHLGYYDYWIIDRKLFHQRLLSNAEKAGCEFIFDTEIVEPMGKGMWVVGVKTKEGIIHNARMIVDCSGRERILGMNIEILDMNLKLNKSDIVEIYREVHKINSKDLNWGEHEIKQNTLYFRYGYHGGFNWLNFDKEDEIDIGAGVGKSITNKSPKGMVNDFVNSNATIDNKKLSGRGDKIIIRRPITLAWYGVMLVGQAACQTISTNGYGLGLAMIASKIAAEVIVPAIRRKEVSIESLWEYQVRFTKERGRDLAAIDILRLGLQKLSEDDASFLMRKKIITKIDLENMIHAKFRKITLLRTVFTAFKGIKRIKLMLYIQKITSQANNIFKHYKKLPEEYNTRKYHEWLLRSMQLFKEIEDLEPNFVGKI